jgi:phosphatidylglycerophosphate synthase
MTEPPSQRRKLFPPRPPRAVYSEANVITLTRLVLSLGFFVAAITKDRELFNFIGLGIHWAGDFLDGLCARAFRQETLVGAEMDIIADRVETLFFFLNFLHFHPGLFLPVVVYVLDFAFADFYLSYQFVKFDIISINYFDRVDRRVYNLNFSPPGKFVNSTIVPLILILAPRIWPAALALAAGLIGVKVYSAGRLIRRLRAGAVPADLEPGKETA